MRTSALRDAALDYVDLVYRVARCLVGAEAAQGLVERTYEAAMVRVQDARKPERMRAWLLGILVECHRRENPRARLELLISEDDGEPLRVLGTAALAEPSEPQARLDVRLRNLAPAVRVALWLIDVELFRGEEVAEILASTPDEVATRVHRARAAVARLVLRSTPLPLRRDA